MILSERIMELRDKIAMVTGSGRGVGKTIALELAHAGAHLAVHYNRSAHEAREVAEQIHRIGQDAHAVQCDLTKPDEIARMFEKIKAAFGHLDILVNNAAVYHRTPIETLTGEQWDEQFAVNSRAPALCIRHAINLMKTSGGAIVNIADIAADKGWAGYPAYCASKGALIALTRSSARGLAKYNIRVNAVSPGVAIWDQDTTEEQKEKVLAQIPLKRPPNPQDIASAVAFLCQQGYITGQVLRVDGGWCM